MTKRETHLRWTFQKTRTQISVYIKAFLGLSISTLVTNQYLPRKDHSSHRRWYWCVIRRPPRFSLKGRAISPLVWCGEDSLLLLLRQALGCAWFKPSFGADAKGELPWRCLEGGVDEGVLSCMRITSEDAVIHRLPLGGGGSNDAMSISMDRLPRGDGDKGDGCL
jgi:hypothetical protein